MSRRIHRLGDHEALPGLTAIALVLSILAASGHRYSTVTTLAFVAR